MNDFLFQKGIFKQGYGIIPKLVMRDVELSSESKAIYAYICSYAGSGCTAFPSIELMSHDLNMSKKRLLKYRKELIDRGYIKIHKQRNANRMANNVYEIVVDFERGQIDTIENFEGCQFEPKQNEPKQFEPKQNDPTINNNVNNNNLKKNNRNNNIEPVCEKTPLDEAIEDFVKYRKQLKKPLTERALNKLLKELDKLATTDESKIEHLEYAMLKGWLTVYPIKETVNNQTTNNPFIKLMQDEGMAF